MKRLVSAVCSYLALSLLWLLHFLPLPALRRVGHVLGVLLFLCARTRREIARKNLRLCFPEWSKAEQERVLRRHLIVFAQSLLDRSIFWWGRRTRLERLIHLKGEEFLCRQDGCPTLLLAPHFVGLDAGGVAVAFRLPVVSVYSHQKNPVFNAVFL
ncbi:MAG: lipid A biosynthesis acyltransferase, partial [Zoogloeaceae bacterium]|nr:lipid A biosynthesis acyltransferase [Zoogloeaceae bacterium]